MFYANWLPRLLVPLACLFGEKTWFVSPRRRVQRCRLSPTSTRGREQRRRLPCKVSRFIPFCTASIILIGCFCFYLSQIQYFATLHSIDSVFASVAIPLPEFRARRTAQASSIRARLVKIRSFSHDPSDKEALNHRGAELELPQTKLDTERVRLGRPEFLAFMSTTSAMHAVSFSLLCFIVSTWRVKGDELPRSCLVGTGNRTRATRATRAKYA